LKVLFIIISCEPLMKQSPHARKRTLPVTPDQIIDACRQKFINILPNPL
jgi:hypothetical protein